MKKIYLSENVKEYRRKNKITQADFGEKLGVTAQAVSKWENEIAFPDLLLIPDIAEMLSLSVDELLLRKTV